ncbi:hypothetical protein FXO38_09075 [Capsicum annuum]|nr:hypothetical protein FXO38_09075 [Capsicum annuum]
MENASLNDHNNTSHSFKPIKLGMEFDSDEDGFNYYNEYAATIGFSVRKEYANKSKAHGYITSRKFTCYKKGYRGKDKRDMLVKKPRKETRTGILYGHALKILDTLNMKDKIPNYYIVKRWKKDATNLMGMEIKDFTEGSDPKAEDISSHDLNKYSQGGSSRS